MRKLLSLAGLLLSGVLLAGCSIPKQEAVKRQETHRILEAERAAVIIRVQQKSAYNLPLEDYELAVDPKLRVTSVRRLTERGTWVKERFEKDLSGGKADLVIHLSKAWLPDADLKLRVDGAMPVEKKAGAAEYRYTIPAEESTNYEMILGLPAGTEVISITPGYSASAKAMAHGRDWYTWKGQLASRKKVEFRVVFKMSGTKE